MVGSKVSEEKILFVGLGKGGLNRKKIHEKRESRLADGQGVIFVALGLGLGGRLGVV